MKRLSVFALFLCVLALFAGCSSKNMASIMEKPMVPAPQSAPTEAAADNYGMAMDEAGWGAETAIVEDIAGNANREKEIAGGGVNPQSQKIIKNAGMGIETREFDLHVQYIKDKANQLGGFVASSNISGKVPEKYTDSGRYAYISVRIPAERMETFLNDARGLATVTYENQSGEDISRAYYDTESRLEIYTTQRDRLLMLLEKAEDMEDIIALETELSRVTYEIESLTASLRNWDNLVSYSTVNIDVSEIPPSSPVAGDDSMGLRMKEGMNRTLNGMSVFFENFLVFVVSFSPVLIVLGVIAVVVIIIMRKQAKKQRARMEEMGYLKDSLGIYGNNKSAKAKRRGKEENNENPKEDN